MARIWQQPSMAPVALPYAGATTITNGQPTGAFLANQIATMVNDHLPIYDALSIVFARLDAVEAAVRDRPSAPAPEWNMPDLAPATSPFGPVGIDNGQVTGTWLANAMTDMLNKPLPVYDALDIILTRLAEIEQLVRHPPLRLPGFDVDATTHSTVLNATLLNQLKRDD